MKGLFRALKIVPYEYLEQELKILIDECEETRKEIREDCIEKINQADKHDGERIIQIMNETQSKLDMQYAVEQALQRLVTKVK
jgi:hypothetical protein